MTTTKREKWAERIEAWRRSGLTAKEFAAQAGCHPETLRHWGWKLKAEAVGRLKPRAGFVEVLAPMVTGLEARSREQVSEPVELVLSRGIRVRVPPRFDAPSLRRLVETLEGR